MAREPSTPPLQHPGVEEDSVVPARRGRKVNGAQGGALWTHGGAIKTLEL